MIEEPETVYNVYLDVREETDNVQFVTEETQVFSFKDKEEALRIFARIKDKMDTWLIPRDLYDEAADGESFE